MGRFTDLDPTVHVASGTKVELAVAFCGVKTLSAVNSVVVVSSLQVSGLYR